MGRDPDLWVNPLEVRPERWGTAAAHQYSFPVFQGGPRICIGMRLALLEVKLLLCTLLQKYTLVVEPRSVPPAYDVTIVLPVKHGLWVKAHRRTGR